MQTGLQCNNSGKTQARPRGIRPGVGRWLGSRFRSLPPPGSKQVLVDCPHELLFPGLLPAEYVMFFWCSFEEGVLSNAFFELHYLLVDLRSDEITR